MKSTTFKWDLTRYWWLPLLTGLVAVALGIWCLCSPMTSLPVLAIAFAICICATGLFNLIFAFANINTLPGWGWAMALGILDIICGIWLFTLPASVLTVAFIYAIGIYLVFVIINSICESLTYYSYSSLWIGWLVAFLLIALVCSFIFLAGPIAGGVAVWLYIGISFICYGVYRIIFSAKLHQINKSLNS